MVYYESSSETEMNMWCLRSTYIKCYMKSRKYPYKGVRQEVLISSPLDKLISNCLQRGLT